MKMKMIPIKFESVLPAARPILFCSLASFALPFTLPTRTDELISGIATARLCLQSHRLDTPCIGHCPLSHAFPTRRLGQVGADSSLLLPQHTLSAVPHKHIHTHSLSPSPSPSPSPSLPLPLSLFPPFLDLDLVPCPNAITTSSGRETQSRSDPLQSNQPSRKYSLCCDHYWSVAESTTFPVFIQGINNEEKEPSRQWYRQVLGDISQNLLPW